MKNINVSYDPDWQQKYQSMIATPEAAVGRIRPGQRIFIGTGCAEPLRLVTALTKRAYELPDTEIIHLLTFGEAPYAHKEMAQFFRVNSFLCAASSRRGWAITRRSTCRTCRGCSTPASCRSMRR